jgi:tetratricopeptide (TPR) repeat protein
VSALPPDAIGQPAPGGLRQAAEDAAEELRQAAEDAAEELRQAALGGPAERFGGSVLAGVRRAATYGQALAAVQEGRRRLEKLGELVDDLERRLQELQQHELEADPFGDAWHELARRELAEATDDDRRRAAWTARYAAAFVADQFGVCAWLCRADEVRPDEELARPMLAAARAARHNELAATVPALDILIAAGDALPPELLARCWCMWARAVGRGLLDPARARDTVEEMLASAPGWPARELGLLRAAFGECLLAGEEPERAGREARIAQRLAPDDPFGHVVRGLVAESIGNYVRSHECYDDAVAVAGDRAVAGELFAPVPAGLLWRYGRGQREQAPGHAVEAISRAISLGIRGGDDWPERKAYVDLARALEARGDRRRAANAYWEAGRRYSWAGDEPSAAAYLKQACQLDDRAAEYRLEYAEALRLRSVHDDGTVDRSLLKQADTSWRAGMELQEPGREIPWAYVTGALIAHEASGDLYRPRMSWWAASLLERGLMVAPDVLRLTAQLSQAHRLLGNRWTALALTQRVLDNRVDDELVFDQHLLALLDLGRHREGLDLLDEHGLRPQEPWLVNRRVQFLLELGRPAEALELLELSPRADESLHDLQVALCNRLLGRPEDARKAYRRVWERQGARAARRRGFLAGWAGYLLDRYDEAADIYTRLVKDDPVDASLACDLGQVLLARGRSELDDLSQGEETLRTGVERTRSAYALTQLDGTELPLLLEKVAGAEHGEAVAEVVARTREQIAAQLADLVAVSSASQELERALERAGDAVDPDLVRRTARAGLARMTTDGDQWDDALERYVALAAGGGDPEVAHAVGRAAEHLCREADDLAEEGDGDPESAFASYQALIEQLERVPSVAPKLLAAAHLRAALVGTLVDTQPGFAGHLAAALSPDHPAPDLDAVVAKAVRSPGHYWRVVDAARSLARVDGAAEAERAAARRLLERLDLSVVLRARHADVDSSRLFPLATPLVLRLGDGLRAAGAQASPSIPQHLARIREEVERDTGVRVPYLSVRPFREDGDAGAYEVDLYELPMALATVPLDRVFVPSGDEPPDGGPALMDPLTGAAGTWVEPAGAVVDGARSPVEFVLDHVDAVVRANLARLFSIDDVGLWLGGVESSMADADRLTRSDRLELLRLLRLLLREQVPIVDRNEIFEVVAKAGPGWSAMDLLPAVRRRIAGRLAAPAPAGRAATTAALPEELEAALAGGLVGTEPGVWQLPRDQAHDLSARLAAWCHQARADTVVVTDPRLRPFVWRLLAGLTRPPATVLDQEELDGRS